MARITVDVKIDILKWACNDCGISLEELFEKVGLSKKLSQESTYPKSIRLTENQVELLAKKTNVPVCYFYLKETPDPRPLNIPDFRTKASKQIKAPSQNLRQTVNDCIIQQEWFREYCLQEEIFSPEFIGSATINSSPSEVAEKVRTLLDLNVAQKNAKNENDFLRYLRDKIESLGVIIELSSIVENNTHRSLDIDEFRGFALSDDLAPLIFVNSRDSKNAQVFTILHEFAHLLLNKSALSDLNGNVDMSTHSNKIESWCNEVAAQTLLPDSMVKEKFEKYNDAEIDVLKNKIEHMRKELKVSNIVVLIRISKCGLIGKNKFAVLYNMFSSNYKAVKVKKGGGGGDFYKTLAFRKGKLFSRSVIWSTLAGDTSFTEAFSLLNISSIASFKKYASSLGINI